jgi:hypothetical protein
VAGHIKEGRDWKLHPQRHGAGPASRWADRVVRDTTCCTTCGLTRQSASAHPDPRTQERLRSVADRASGEFREITRAGLMTVRGTTRAGLVIPLVISQLFIPQAFAPITPRSPWQNGHVERLIGSIRRECLDHVVVLGERHLRHLLANYATYYNGVRTHLALDKDTPLHRPAQTVGRIASVA